MTNLHRMLARLSLYSLGAAIVATSAIGLFWHGPTTKPYDPIADYSAEIATLQLPPGWHWPSSPGRALGPNVYIMERWGAQWADLLWFCAWSQRGLDRTQPLTVRHAALARLLELPNTAVYRDVWNNTQQRDTIVAVRMALGGERPTSGRWNLHTWSDFACAQHRGYR